MNTLPQNIAPLDRNNSRSGLTGEWLQTNDMRLSGGSIVDSGVRCRTDRTLWFGWLALLRPHWVPAMNITAPSMEVGLEALQRETFDYFLHEANPVSGLVVYKSAETWPATMAATGLALACYPIGVERGFMSRSATVARTLSTLRFF